MKPPCSSTSSPEVALKLIKTDIAVDEKAVARFKRELKLARKIVHKNVGRVFELMDEKGIRFISMEYVPGEDLKSFIRDQADYQSRKL